jgi:hypothetical protein
MTYTQAKRSMTKKLTLFIFLNTTIVPFAIFLYRIITVQDSTQNAYD